MGSGSIIILVIAGILLLSVFLLVIGLSGKPSGQGLVEERLGRREKKKKKGDGEKRESAVSLAIDRAVAGRSFAQNLSTQLAQANLKWTVGEFIGLTLALSMAAGLIPFVLKRPIFIPIGFMLGFFAPRIFLGMSKAKRLKDFNGQLGDALNLIVNSLRAGYSTMQAMEVISNEMPEPIAEEFGRVVFELQLGISFDTTMENFVRRMPSGDLDLVATAMSVQREVGGNLAEVLDAISFTIRERVRIKGEVKSMTAQGRLTGYVVTGIPFALGAFISWVNPDFMSGLFTDPCGYIMIGISLALIVLGYFTINKIVSIEV